MRNSNRHPLGAPIVVATPQRERIPIGYWLVACLIGVVAANVVATFATPTALPNPPAVPSAAPPPLRQTTMDLAQLWDAEAAQSPAAATTAARARTTEFRGFGGGEGPAAVRSVPGNFVPCGRGPRINCVVDGDTLWINGRKVRIADMDTPEIHNPRCAGEAARGQRAKQRLLELVNSGDVTVDGAEGDNDRYGRALRRVRHNGKSVGETMVGEGLAHDWDGRRHPWCG